MLNKGAPKKGIEWSLPVLVQRGSDGKLFVALPDQAAGYFGVVEGDVLNWTKLPDGTVEAWTIKKSTYSSLEDLKPVAGKGK